jgi:hypothetical protein
MIDAVTIHREFEKDPLRGTLAFPEIGEMEVRIVRLLRVVLCRTMLFQPGQL